MAYTVEQFRDYCRDLDKTIPIKCPICGKLYSYKGLWTHIDRCHNESKQYSNGNNGCYHKLEYLQILKKGINEHYDEKLGGFREFEVKCYKCQKKIKVIERENKFPTKSKYFCSSKCSHSHVLSEETKQKLSAQAKKRRKYPLYNVCKYCGEKTKSWKIKFCSSECHNKWKRRNLSEYKKYRLDCQFTFALNDFPDEFDFSLIEKHGWYKASNHGNNLSGVSRDHMYSIFDGFKNNIEPKIISHPANCKLMQHKENSSKYKKSSITLKQLLMRIDAWDKKYGARDC